MRKELFRHLFPLRFWAQCQAGLVVAPLLFFNGCPPPPPPPPTATLSEFQPNIGRGGRSVAISVYTGDYTHVAIAASERGGLFRTSDGGQTWSHVDSLPAFRMSDVAFVLTVFTNPNIVIATALHDSNPDPQANQGGIWASSDGGATWTHVVLPGPCSSPPASGFGIAYVPVDIVYIATDCGLVVNRGVGIANWMQPSNWSVLNPAGMTSVTAQFATSGPNAGAIVIDACRQGGGHQRSVDSGRTWSAVSSGPGCQSPHSIAASPLDSNVLFATSFGSCWNGSTLLESDDGGSTWPINLQACSYSGRPPFVATHAPVDQNPAHFDLYYSGRMTTCSYAATGQRCLANTNDSWAFIPNVPGTNLNHDINGIALSPYSDNCALYEVSDFGVLKTGGASPGTPCGNVAAWTLISNASAGFGALQIYDTAGLILWPVSGGGINVSSRTNLFIGTMDNLEWATADTSTAIWQGFGAEGSFLQVLNNNAMTTQAPDLRLNFVDFGGGGFQAQTIVPNIANGTWANPQPWTGVSPPGNGAPSFLVAPHTYVEWTGSTAFDPQPGNSPNVLYLTQDNGQSWLPVGNLPSNLTPFNRIQVANRAVGPSGPPGSGISGFAISDGQHAFYVATDQHVHQLWYNLQRWIDQDLTCDTQGQPPLAAPGGGMSSFWDSYGEHVYYVANDQHVHRQLLYNVQSSIDTDLTSSTGGPSAPPGSGVSSGIGALNFPGSDAEHVYYVANDQHIHRLWYNRQTWFDQDLTGSAQGQPPLATPSSGISSFGDSYGEHVYYVANDQHVHQLWRNTQIWTDQDLTSSTGGPSAPPGSEVSSGIGVLTFLGITYAENVYYVANDQHIHRLWYNTQSWADQDLTKSTTPVGPSAPPGSGISSFTDKYGEHVYYVASDQHVHQLWGNIQTWIDTDLTQSTNGPSAPPGSRTSSFGDSYGEHVYYVATDQHVHQLWYNLQTWIDQDLTRSATGLHPVVYDMVADSTNGNQGIAMLACVVRPVISGPLPPFEVRTIGGTNDRGLPSGLKAIWGNCFGDGAWYCAPVFSADPNDHRHLYAVDSMQRFVAMSHDAGETWQEDVGLMNLVTAGGVSMADSTGNSQVHVFAFDPANSSHILVGTDQAGIFASANGGLTWSALPNTARATGITSFFFDDRTNTVYVGTYGRGLWKLTLDWTTVH
jgi:hypothetical protein